MKKTIRPALLILILPLLLGLLRPGVLHGQGRLGYIDEADIIRRMPESHAVKLEMRRTLKLFTADLERHWLQVDSAYRRFDSLAPSWDRTQLAAEHQALRRMDADLTDAVAYFKSAIADRAANDLRPIQHKVRAAVKAVMAQQGLMAVVNVSEYPFDPFSLLLEDVNPGFRFRMSNMPNYEAILEPPAPPPLEPAIYPGPDALDVNVLVMKKLGVEAR